MSNSTIKNYNPSKPSGGTINVDSIKFYMDNYSPVNENNIVGTKKENYDLDEFVENTTELYTPIRSVKENVDDSISDSIENVFIPPNDFVLPSNIDSEEKYDLDEFIETKNDLYTPVRAIHNNIEDNISEIVTDISSPRPDVLSRPYEKEKIDIDKFIENNSDLYLPIRDNMNKFQKKAGEILINVFEKTANKVVYAEEGIENVRDSKDLLRILGINTAAFISHSVGSFVSSFLSLGEGFIDSHIYGTAKTVNWYFSAVLSFWKKPIELLSNSTNTNIEKIIPQDLNFTWDDKIVGYDVSGKVKDSIIWTAPFESETLFTKAGDMLGSMFGNMLGKMSLKAIPYVGSLAVIFACAGEKSEESINDQYAKTGCVNDFHVLIKSLGGSLEGFASGDYVKYLPKGKLSEVDEKVSNNWFSKSFSKIKDKYSTFSKKILEKEADISKYYTNPKNVKNIFKGLGETFGSLKGVWKTHIIHFPKVLTKSGIEALKDPGFWIDTGGKTVNSFVSIIEGQFPKSSELFNSNYMKKFGFSFMDVIANLDNFKK